DTLCLAMIETREALALAGDIVAMEGIDGVLVGPADLSIDWTSGETVNPALDEMMPEIDRVAAVAKAGGKIAAIYSADPAFAGRYARMGYALIAYGTEAMYMGEGVRNLQALARKTMEG